MCNVCAASKALSGGYRRGDIGYEIRAVGTGEFQPARYQIRKVGDAWPNGWVKTVDLSGSIAALGFDDRKINFRRHRTIVEIAIALQRGDLDAMNLGLALGNRFFLWLGSLTTFAERTRRWLWGLGRMHSPIVHRGGHVKI
jgi:hypothetical protein